MAKRCGRCESWRKLDEVRGECRAHPLKAGEAFREVRPDDPGCGEFKAGRWDRG
jgi:hypothetical protein